MPTADVDLSRILAELLVIVADDIAARLESEIKHEGHIGTAEKLTQKLDELQPRLASLKAELARVTA